MGTTAMHPMKKITSRALVAVAAMLAPWACFAVDGTITINGTVTNETCTINGGTPNITVTLPNVSKSTLNVNGAVAAATPFSIALTSCSITTSGSLFAYFEPGSTINAAGRLINAGTATNLDVELLNSSFGTIDLSKTSGNQNSTTIAATAATTSATLTYYARYRATGVVGPGTVNSSVTYTLIYP